MASCDDPGYWCGCCGVEVSDLAPEHEGKNYCLRCYRLLLLVAEPLQALLKEIGALRMALLPQVDLLDDIHTSRGSDPGDPFEP